MEKNLQEFNQSLLAFIAASPSPFHATKVMSEALAEVGFVPLREQDDWQLMPNQGYFVTRNESSIIAFHTGQDLGFSTGIRMVGAHTDSPCLKIKPNPELGSHGCQRLAVEVYGGVLLGTWFDRDLSLAGRVTYQTTSGEVASVMIDIGDPIAHVPSLAIHLDRKANENRTIQRQKELNLVLAVSDEKQSFRDFLLEYITDHHDDVLNVERVLDYEIYAYDTQKPAVTGLKKDFISSARLDNLLSCFIGLEALINANSDQAVMLICTDHEEVGSQSACGAQGSFLRDLLERLCESKQHMSQVMATSMMVSVDNAHALHPNFPDAHDGNHGPKINAGPVIKMNANQRYATNSETAARFRAFASEASVPTQTFVVRNDMGCGSTIGPISASEVGVATVDVGCPQWGMHSIRETAGSKDAAGLLKVLQAFYRFDKPISSV